MSDAKFLVGRETKDKYATPTELEILSLTFYKDGAPNGADHHT